MHRIMKESCKALLLVTLIGKCLFKMVAYLYLKIHGFYCFYGDKNAHISQGQLRKFSLVNI